MILNCVKTAYKEMIKDGLTPLEFNFPSFQINESKFNATGLSVLIEKVKVGLLTNKYNLNNELLSYDYLLEVENKIKNGIASVQEKTQIEPILNTLLAKKIETDPQINRIEMSHAILNKVCGESMGVLLSELVFFKGFKTLDEKQQLKMDRNDYNLNMNVNGNTKENQFIASLIMLKFQLPKAYKVANLAITTYAEREVNIDFIKDKDMNDKDKLSLANNIVKENKIIKNMVYFIQQQEKNPSKDVIIEIAKCDKKFAQENFPIIMREIEAENKKSMYIKF